MLNKLKQIRETGSEEGFTLIELMIVVVIIGVLAAVAIPIFSNQQTAAIKAGVKQDVRNLQTLVVTYLVKYPTAQNLQWRLEGGGQTAGKALNDDPYWQKLVAGLAPSHPYTVLIVREQFSHENEQPGSWNQYFVLGANQQLVPPGGGYYYYFFNSATGRYGEAN